MRRILCHQPSPAMVVALLGLFFALGGVGYAATKLPANSVGTKQLKNNAVKPSKIAARAVNGSRVAPDSLTGANIAESSLAPVPSAANATHAASADTAANATHASNADTVGGRSVAAFFLELPSPTPPQTVLTLGGAVLKLECGPAQDPHVTLTGSVSHSLIRGAMITESGSAGPVGQYDVPAGTPVVLLIAPGRGEVAAQYAQPDGHGLSLNMFVGVARNGGVGCSISGSGIAG